MNIVLISMDCVRPDYLVSSGLERLKDKGLVFTQCIAQAPHTSTSHVSILTGMYPFHHGVRWLVDFKVQTPMIQEILKGHGYKTAAFIGGFPLSQGNMDKGFDLFEYTPVCEDNMEGRGDYTPANILVTRAINWMRESAGQDHFVFLHFFDGHLTLRSELGDKTYNRRINRYREEIDLMGRQIERLLAFVYVDLLILTSDHGEKMVGEKDYPWVTNSCNERISSHFHEAELYDIQLHVPLILYGKPVTPGIITDQVRSIDILPTILEYAGIEPPLTNGNSLIHGNYPEFVYSETYFAQSVEANRHCYEMNQKYDWGWKGIDSLVSIRSNQWKLICTANGVIRPYMLFDLINDPCEDCNIIQESKYQDLLHRLYEEVIKIIGDDRQYKITGCKVDEIVAEKLKLLGYL